MKVVIPVAGAGTRLRPHTLTRPKVMLPVGGKPMLGHVLDPLLALKPDEVIFVIGQMGQQVREYVSKNYSFKATFVRQEELLGLGYALHLGVDRVNDGPLVIVLGDTIVDCNCEEFATAGEYVLGLRQVADPQRFGIAEISDGYVARLQEKPKEPRSDLALIGLYYFTDTKALKEHLNALVTSGKTTRGEIQFTDALQGMIEAGIRFAPFEVEDWYDCGKKETWLETNRHMLSKSPPPPDIQGSTLTPPVHVSPAARIISSHLGPNVSVADGAVVENSTLKNTIIGSETKVVRSALEDSLVGQRATVIGVTGVVNIGDYSCVHTG